MNREAREQWVMNDEGLYNAFMKSGKSLDKFIKEDMGLIDEVADAVVSGKKPAHYLAYPDYSGRSRKK